MSTVLAYVETKRGYFARYSGKTRTHFFEVEEWSPDADVPYWVEQLRVNPAAWEPLRDPEAA